MQDSPFQGRALSHLLLKHTYEVGTIFIPVLRARKVGQESSSCRGDTVMRRQKWTFAPRSVGFSASATAAVCCAGAMASVGSEFSTREPLIPATVLSGECPAPAPL